MIPLHPGGQLDDYRIEGVVARSGMASIFRGTDLRTGRPVAIKVSHPEMESDPVFFERFHREEEIGKKLDHPGVMKVFADDDRSDLYALGVMLYEMLTGKVPFTGPNPFVIMNDRLLNNPVPPREINPEISPQLQEIIYRALERDPNKRYASAHEFAWDLEHQDQVGAADRPELRDWKRRRSPWPKGILFYVVLALIPVIIFALLFYVARHT